MRRRILSALMISLCLLSGCGAGSEMTWEDFDAFRQTLETARSLHFTAEVTADEPEGVFCCTLDCQEEDGNMTLEVLSPELCRGISARVEGEKGTLVYDGLQLYVGEMSGVSPLMAVCLMTRAMRQSGVRNLYTESGEEETLLCVQLSVDEDSTALVTFRGDDEGLLPVCAELIRNGEAQVKCLIRDFTLS